MTSFLRGWLSHRKHQHSAEAAAPSVPLNEVDPHRRSGPGSTDHAGRVVEHHGLKYFVTGEATEARAKYALEKEPLTIAWIETFEAGEEFWDIGANVGIFSVYAAAKRNCLVTSFEPVFLNYYILNRTIAANALNSRIRALAIAIGGQCGFSDMHLSDLEDGSALHSYAEPIDYRGVPYAPVFRQAVACFDIDTLTKQFGFGVPAHIKVDVDGIEDAILIGASATLSNPAIKSVLVELDAMRDEFVAAAESPLAAAGFERVGAHHPNPQSRVKNYLYCRPHDHLRYRAVLDAIASSPHP